MIGEFEFNRDALVAAMQMVQKRDWPFNFSNPSWRRFHVYECYRAGRIMHPVLKVAYIDSQCFLKDHPLNIDDVMFYFRRVRNLMIPLILNEAINIGKSWLFEQKLAELLHEHAQMIFTHGGDEHVMHAALAE